MNVALGRFDLEIVIETDIVPGPQTVATGRSSIASDLAFPAQRT